MNPHRCVLIFAFLVGSTVFTFTGNANASMNAGVVFLFACYLTILP